MNQEGSYHGKPKQWGAITGGPSLDDVTCHIRVCMGLQWYKTKTRINWNKLTWSLLCSFLCVSMKFQAISASFTPVRREGRKRPGVGKMWIEAIFQEIIDCNQSRSFTAAPSFRTGVKLAEISRNFAETQRKECTRLQVSLFQFISRTTVLPYKPLFGTPLLGLPARKYVMVQQAERG